MTNVEMSNRARAVHDRAIVWDAHCDTLQRLVIDNVDLGLPSTAQADPGGGAGRLAPGPPGHSHQPGSVAQE